MLGNRHAQALARQSGRGAGGQHPHWQANEGWQDKGQAPSAPVVSRLVNLRLKVHGQPDGSGQRRVGAKADQNSQHDFGRDGLPVPFALESVNLSRLQNPPKTQTFNLKIVKTTATREVEILNDNHKTAKRPGWGLGDATDSCRSNGSCLTPAAPCHSSPSLALGAMAMTKGRGRGRQGRPVASSSRLTMVLNLRCCGT